VISLIDADLIAFRCAASAEHDPSDIAEIRVNELMQRILYETNATDYIGFLTGSNNFRYELYPQYKANRKDKPRPTHLDVCKELLVKQWKCKVTDGIEADDALGIEQDKEGDSTRPPLQFCTTRTEIHWKCRWATKLLHTTYHRGCQ
jgi:5'-3' exonuclease